ncbi:MAG: hypothetical protein U5O39_09815 [Gammaproteobacteria bacterium]|nr:hypothetical protein [Gammaproteobacteria bacterium]
MDQRAIDAFTPPVRERVFASRDLKAQQLVDLGGFESFVFACESRRSILRITHTSHRDADQLLAELEWIADLHHHGAAVCRPLPGPSGELVTPVDSLQLPQMPLFLKIRELSLYGVVHAFLGGGDPDNWYVTKFMTDRRRRIEAGEPYLDIPFD